jgi:hypothetical protein
LGCRGLGPRTRGDRRLDDEEEDDEEEEEELPDPEPLRDEER